MSAAPRGDLRERRQRAFAAGAAEGRQLALDSETARSPPPSISGSRAGRRNRPFGKPARWSRRRPPSSSPLCWPKKLADGAIAQFPLAAIDRSRRKECFAEARTAPHIAVRVHDEPGRAGEGPPHRAGGRPRLRRQAHHPRRAGDRSGRCPPRMGGRQGRSRPRDRRAAIARTLRDISHRSRGDDAGESDERHRSAASRTRRALCRRSRRARRQRTEDRRTISRPCSTCRSRSRPCSAAPSSRSAI